jgi:hypothetical protein
MPNHIHIIAQFTDEYPLADMMRDFKKLTARQIYRQFQAEENAKVLDVLRKEGEQVKQEYKVWEDGYDARDVFSVEFLQHKMNMTSEMGGDVWRERGKKKESNRKKICSEKACERDKENQSPKEASDINDNHEENACEGDKVKAEGDCKEVVKKTTKKSSR